MAEFWNLTRQIADTGLPGGSPAAGRWGLRLPGRLIVAH